MAETSTNVTEGAGKRQHGWDRTIASVLVQDQFVLPGEYPYPSYFVVAAGISGATANDHLLQLMAGSSNYVRIRRIRVEQRGLSTAKDRVSMDVLRLTTAGSGGSALTPARFDLGDPAAGAAAMSLPSSKGSESTQLMSSTFETTQAGSATATNPEEMWEWVQHPGTKPLIIPAGTSNGIVIKNLTASAGTSWTLSIEFVETPWLGA